MLKGQALSRSLMFIPMRCSSNVAASIPLDPLPATYNWCFNYMIEYPSIPVGLTLYHSALHSFYRNSESLLTITYCDEGGQPQLCSEPGETRVLLAEQGVWGFMLNSCAFPKRRPTPCSVLPGMFCEGSFCAEITVEPPLQQQQQQQRPAV